MAKSQKPTLRFWGKIKDGKFVLSPEEKKAFALAVSSRPDGEYYISEPRKVYAKHSQEQHGYYFVLMTILGNELGITKDEAHEICKQKFLPVWKGILRRPVGGSTVDLNRWEMTVYIDQIREWAAITHLDPDGDFNVPIILPPPHRVDVD